MIPVTLESFMRQLRSETEAGRFNWSSSDGNSYFCNHKNFTLYISRYYDAENEIDSITFHIMTGEKNSSFIVYQSESDYGFMRTLYEAISVNANGLGTALDSFFD